MQSSVPIPNISPRSRRFDEASISNKKNSQTGSTEPTGAPGKGALTQISKSAGLTAPPTKIPRRDDVITNLVVGSTAKKRNSEDPTLAGSLVLGSMLGSSLSTKSQSDLIDSAGERQKMSNHTSAGKNMSKSRKRRLEQSQETTISSPVSKSPHPLSRSLVRRHHTMATRSMTVLERVKNTPQGLRIQPEKYLSGPYIKKHLVQFKKYDAHYLTPAERLDEFGRARLGRPDGVFVMRGDEMRDMLEKVGDSCVEIEKNIGLDSGSWQGKKIKHLIVKNAHEFGLRMASGNEIGTNRFWKPGGKIPSGYSEAVLDQIPKGKYVERLIRGSTR